MILLNDTYSCLFNSVPQIEAYILQSIISEVRNYPSTVTIELLPQSLSN